MLVVGLNSDDSVRNIKGPLRPINPEALRAEVLAGLACVDYVILFDEADPLALIQALRPDVLVKGADWPEDQIVGADFVKQQGGRVERIALVQDISTSALIQLITERYC
jgi:D-beta-D-heptose 7-phosphate kinase/D-beta-D-heptose 1-phosphate adenosyltransferase